MDFKYVYLEIFNEGLVIIIIKINLKKSLIILMYESLMWDLNEFLFKIFRSKKLIQNQKWKFRRFESLHLKTIKSYDLSYYDFFSIILWKIISNNPTKAIHLKNMNKSYSSHIMKVMKCEFIYGEMNIANLTHFLLFLCFTTILERELDWMER